LEIVTDQEPGLCGWTTCTALAMRHHYLTVLTMAGVFTTVNTAKTCLCTVHTVSLTYVTLITICMLLHMGNAYSKDIG